MLSWVLFLAALPLVSMAVNQQYSEGNLRSFSGGMAHKTTCGKSTSRPNVTMKIVGGNAVFPGLYPWMVLLLKYKANVVNGKTNHTYVPYCGGTIINRKFVLTAAHCVRPVGFALLGAHEISHTSLYTRLANFFTTPFIRIKRFIPFSEWDGVTIPDHDIALAELWTSVFYSDRIKPICLPHKDIFLEAPGIPVHSAGWGVMEVQSHPIGRVHSVLPPDAEILQHVDLEILPDRSCSAVYSKFNSTIHICSGYPPGGKDSCLGDSGGPLMLDDEGRWTQLGLVSFGKGCGLGEFPAVYTRLSYYLDWIDRHTDYYTADY